ncbi:citrate synthase [Acidovorax delafieldii 2AN]|uniref:citrate synthase (unknown stereospecificity) n=1 Tax=Acidovorax delafieldii 2AN TaxID=573060 RepID=C5T792_ACIDE|nr:citryl-CoA lyase [Acidovorax delafieldii]EER59660.1 citrate synthase [Acidovorax delafieldii 2AN]
MTTTKKTPTTSLCTHTLTSLTYGNANLVADLMGKTTFTEVMLMQILGRKARPVDLRVTDVVLIVLMEHGLTPSAIATRLIYMSAPENLQGAVSAGLLAVGSSFVGTMENCSGLLDRIIAAPDAHAEALEIARHYKALKSPVPGFGHHLHKPVDPRAYKLLELGRAEPELHGNRIRALETLSKAVDEVAGRAITINATGAVAALLGEIEVPTAIMRGFAVISRAAGLVAHIVEEQRDPSGRFIWDTVEHAIPFVSPGAATEA